MHTQARHITLANINATIERLNAILTMEIHALEERNVKALNDYYEEKHRLTKQMELYMQLLKKDHRLLKESSEPEKIAFQSLIATFQPLLKQNFQLLRSASKYNEQLMKFVAKAVANENPTPFAYNASGSEARDIHHALPLSINQQI